MKKLNELFLASCLALTSCSSTSIQRKQIESFESRFYTSPLKAVFPNFEFSENELRALTMEAKREFPEQLLPYDFIPGCDGDILMGKLKEQIKDEKFDYRTLLFVFVGSGHLNSACINLNKEFNLFYFSEAPHTRDEETALYFLYDISQFYRKHGYNLRLEDRKPNVIIYGDDYGFDFDFTGHFPTVRELKNLGIERIIFACEGIMPRDDLTVEDLDYNALTAMNDKYLFEYLKESEREGIRVKVLGIEFRR